MPNDISVDEMLRILSDDDVRQEKSVSSIASEWKYIDVQPEGFEPTTFAVPKDTSAEEIERITADAKTIITSKSADIETKRDYSADERKQLAKEGKALPDGSFPIVTVEDLENAVRSIGRASDEGAAKAHIIKRARALDALDKLPEEWNVSKAATSNVSTDSTTISISDKSKILAGGVLEKLAELEENNRKLGEAIAALKSETPEGDAEKPESSLTNDGADDGNGIVMSIVDQLSAAWSVFLDALAVAPEAHPVPAEAFAQLSMSIANELRDGDPTNKVKIADARGLLDQGAVAALVVKAGRRHSRQDHAHLEVGHGALVALGYNGCAPIDAEDMADGGVDEATESKSADKSVTAAASDKTSNPMHTNDVSEEVKALRAELERVKAESEAQSSKLSELSRVKEDFEAAERKQQELLQQIEEREKAVGEKPEGDPNEKEAEQTKELRPNPLISRKTVPAYDKAERYGGDPMPMSMREFLNRER